MYLFKRFWVFYDTYVHHSKEKERKKHIPRKNRVLKILLWSNKLLNFNYREGGLACLAFLTILKPF